MTKSGAGQPRKPTVLDLCTGAGGEALGIEGAGFACVAAVDNDPDACRTLRHNRPAWQVIEDSLANIDGASFDRVDLVAVGVPCPPFSMAGKQLGHEDERDLFPLALNIIEDARPAAVLLENVRGFASARFDDYRHWLFSELRGLGYEPQIAVLQASDFGVPQLRPRCVIVAMRPKYMERFVWPSRRSAPKTVGQTLEGMMGARGWPGAQEWAKRANGVAPTLVGGSSKHGGPDLGPTRAKQRWLQLGVDGMGLVKEAPGPDDPIDLAPRLTVEMAARIQGFPAHWHFTGGKTAAYRQVGNAFPPPVARAVGKAIKAALLQAHIVVEDVHPYVQWQMTEDGGDAANRVSQEVIAAGS